MKKAFLFSLLIWSGQWTWGAPVCTSVHQSTLQVAAASFQKEMAALIKGQPNQLATQVQDFANFSEFDRQRRALPIFKDPAMKPLILKIQEELYNNDAFLKWILDLHAEVLQENEKLGNLKWGPRGIAVYDLKSIAPYQGDPPQAKPLHLENVPLVSVEALNRVLDRHARQFGFDENSQKVFSQQDYAPGSSVIGSLPDHSDFEILTAAFMRLSKNHVLFLDAHFKSKPHGEYPHIFQWLYLGSCLKKAWPNESSDQITAQLRKVMDYLMDDQAVGELVIDWPGQKNASSPNYVNQIARLLFPVH